MSDEQTGFTYADSGVDIDAAEESVERIKEHVRSTFRPEVIGDVGGFGGLFSFDKERFRDPVLVSTTDGVGTKAYVAAATGRYDTIGIDLVATCTDDLVCQGAEPLFFLDYISVGNVDPDVIDGLVAGVASGCRYAGCALVGGEISEHPGAMRPGEFDFVGFAVGVVERDAMLGAHRVAAGDALIGLPSPGLRCNGYSLARKVLLEVAARSYDDAAFAGTHRSVADELLEPSVIYSPSVLALMGEIEVHAAAHITGGGLIANGARILPTDCDAEIDVSRWERPEIFNEIQRLGAIKDTEMARTFNLGVGMILAVSHDVVEQALDVLRENGQRARHIGNVIPGNGVVQLIG